MREGGGEIKEGSGMNKWVSDQGKESERGRERERALWIVSGLRHSVNRRCFCMRCQCTGLLQGIARSFASHIYRPCLPDQHQPPAASSSWLTKHLESKGVNKTCEPQGMHVAYKQIPATGMTRNAVTQENWEEESPLQYIYFFLAFVTGDTINSLNGFKPQKTVISFWDEHSISTAQLKLNQRGGEKTDTQKLFFIGFSCCFGCLFFPLILAAEDCRGAKETELMHADRGTCTSYHLAESYLDSSFFWLFHLKRTKTL